jgi:acetoin utilization deacetylase AcuC-like enzyme
MTPKIVSALAIGCERVAIWDFDAHHGNGTEEIVLGNWRIRFALARFGADRNWLC